ncbi:SHOCT-like domain-containing protein [Actinomadura decatromicini]|uniref:DUF2089 domain-containing protein n=1 Tax=Actinomadura decatromicini TaxID=2604572 RepID=A0A5D3F7E7_9ACTN|nr:DUF2089 domain-containing protein [Actinomadura decatromicini]TYK43630.1 DUF2089 domain-containing protein [Actinomadura decatromicini]
MNEQRRQILQMLAEGKITVDEAERLINAVQKARPEPPPPTTASPTPRPKYLRVLVSWTDSGGDGPGRINVRVPLQLLRAGVRLASLVPPRALARANVELDKAGVPIDLTELKPQHLEDLIEHLDEVTVDVDDPDAKVQVLCE